MILLIALVAVALACGAWFILKGELDRDIRLEWSQESPFGVARKDRRPATSTSDLCNVTPQGSKAFAAGPSQLMRT